jgi:uncharacterized protein (TIGR03437 family)
VRHAAANVYNGGQLKTGLDQVNDGEFQMRRTFLIRSVGALAFLALLLTSTSRRGTAFEILARWRADANYYYVESTGIPTHRMMVGITAWQQQIPLPQDFTGGNAFRIPRNPVMSDNPISAKQALFSGAIAVAVNGVPIFNPIKNDGRTDTYLAGELDDFGGHCGRADDYHYHIAPLHLVDVVGPATPIGYALDGYPLYGIAEIDGSTVTGLDQFNGHTFQDNYHYHSTKTYPYVNGGMRGVVQVQNDAITPQPVTTPIRPAGNPLPGARIVGFTWPLPNHYSLEYVVGSAHSFINYSVNDDNTYTLNFVDPTGQVTTRTYPRAPSGPTLYSVGGNGVAAGYVTRVRGQQQLTEQFVQSVGGQAAAVPIDVSQASDEVFLVLYGSNLGASARGTATIGGVPATLTYAAPLTPYNGVAQYNIAIPSSLAGTGKVYVVVNVNNKSSNPVNVTIR